MSRKAPSRDHRTMGCSMVRVNKRNRSRLFTYSPSEVLDTLKAVLIVVNSNPSLAIDWTAVSTLLDGRIPPSACQALWRYSAYPSQAALIEQDPPHRMDDQTPLVDNYVSDPEERPREFARKDFASVTAAGTKRKDGPNRPSQQAKRQSLKPGNTGNTLGASNKGPALKWPSADHKALCEFLRERAGEHPTGKQAWAEFRDEYELQGKPSDRDIEQRVIFIEAQKEKRRQQTSAARRRLKENVEASVKNNKKRTKVKKDSGGGRSQDKDAKEDASPESSSSGDASSSSSSSASSSSDNDDDNDDDDGDGGEGKRSGAGDTSSDSKSERSPSKGEGTPTKEGKDDSSGSSSQAGADSDGQSGGAENELEVAAATAGWM